MPGNLKQTHVHRTPHLNTASNICANALHCPRSVATE